MNPGNTILYTNQGQCCSDIFSEDIHSFINCLPLQSQTSNITTNQIINIFPGNGSTVAPLNFINVTNPCSQTYISVYELVINDVQVPSYASIRPEYVNIPAGSCLFMFHCEDTYDYLYTVTLYSDSPSFDGGTTGIFYNISSSGGYPIPNNTTFASGKGAGPFYGTDLSQILLGPYTSVTLYSGTSQSGNSITFDNPTEYISKVYEFCDTTAFYYYYPGTTTRINDNVLSMTITLILPQDSFYNDVTSQILVANYIGDLNLAFDNSISGNVSYQYILPALEVIYGNLNITTGQYTENEGFTGGTNIINISGFDRLRAVYGNIEIKTDYINGIPTFSSLEYCQSLNITATYQGTTANGSLICISNKHFPVLTKIDGILNISYQGGLIELCGFNSLTYLGSATAPQSTMTNNEIILNYNDNDSSISINSMMNNNYGYILSDAFNIPVYPYSYIDKMNNTVLSIVFNGINNNSLTKITGFNSLRYVNGHINISSNAFSSITRNNYIYGFNSLVIVENLIIGYYQDASPDSQAPIDQTSLPNTNLNQIIGFNNLIRAGAITIMDNQINPTLYRIRGFGIIRTINSRLWFAFTNKLSDVNGFNNLKSCDLTSIDVYKISSLPAIPILQKNSNYCIINTHSF